MKDPIEYNVRAVERALQILDCFDGDNPERGISEISEIVGLHKATTHRIVTTLMNYGYIERGGDGQKYRLGLRLASLGYNIIHRMDLRREAIPFMTRIMQKWDEACDLSVYDRGEVFFVEIMRGSHALSVAADIGQRLPAHCTANGKIFLAHMPPLELDAILKQPLKAYTPKTITSPQALRKHLEQVRQQGFGSDFEEFEVGIHAVSAPIRNQNDEVIAAMSILGPASRITLARVPAIADSLIQASEEVSHRLGWKI